MLHGAAADGGLRNAQGTPQHRSERRLAPHRYATGRPRAKAGPNTCASHFAVTSRLSTSRFVSREWFQLCVPMFELPTMLS